MTREEWNASDDGLAMLLWFQLSWLGDRADRDRLTQRYCLACCRRIGKLLPDEASRQAVKVGQRFNQGQASRLEWELAIYRAQGAAYNLQGTTGQELNEHPEAETVRRWINEVAAIPPEEIGRMVQPKPSGQSYAPEGLLESAAGFVEYTLTCYNGWGKPSQKTTRRGLVHWLTQYAAFLPASLLRETVGHTLRVPASKRHAKCHFRATRKDRRSAATIEG